MYVHNNSIYSRSFEREREGGLFSRGYVRVDVIGVVILISKPMTMTMTWLLLLLLLLLSVSWMSSVIDNYTRTCGYEIASIPMYGIMWDRDQGKSARLF